MVGNLTCLTFDLFDDIILVYYHQQLLMNLGKISIKSKKEKLSEKMQSKKVVPIEILSSEDELYNQPIQKRRSKNTDNNQSNKNSTYNNFNPSKLKKVQHKQQPIEIDRQLEIVQDIQINPMNHIDSRLLFTYRIEGEDNKKYVSDMYLEQRVKKIEAQNMVEDKEGKINIKNLTENEEIVLVDPQKQEKEERRKSMRYFDIINEIDDENRLIKCFRCGKKGHIAKNCIQQQQKQKCMYCLGEHYHHDCNSRACFRCNQLGHVAQECRAHGIECHKCGKKGHLEKNCGSIMYLDYSRIKNDKQFRDRFDKNDLKQLRCLAGCKYPNGHFNCFEYNSTTHKPYESYYMPNYWQQSKYPSTQNNFNHRRQQNERPIDFSFDNRRKNQNDRYYYKKEDDSKARW